MGVGVVGFLDMDGNDRLAMDCPGQQYVGACFLASHWWCSDSPLTTF